MKLDSFLLGMVNFFDSGRKFFHGTPVNDIDFVRSQAKGRTRRVHGYIAPAQNGRLLSFGDRSIVFGEKVRFHQIGAGEVFVGRINPVKIFARDIHKGGEACAGPEENCVIAVSHQLIYGINLPDDHIGLYFHPNLL